MAGWRQRVAEFIVRWADGPLVKVNREQLEAVRQWAYNRQYEKEPNP